MAVEATKSVIGHAQLLRYMGRQERWGAFWYFLLVSSQWGVNPGKGAGVACHSWMQAAAFICVGLADEVEPFFLLTAARPVSAVLHAGPSSEASAGSDIGTSSEAADLLLDYMQDEVGLEALQGYNTQQLDRALRKVMQMGTPGRGQLAHQLTKRERRWRNNGVLC